MTDHPFYHWDADQLSLLSDATDDSNAYDWSRDDDAVTLGAQTSQAVAASAHADAGDVAGDVSSDAAAYDDGNSMAQPYDWGDGLDLALFADDAWGADVVDGVVESSDGFDDLDDYDLATSQVDTWDDDDVFRGFVPAPQDRDRVSVVNVRVQRFMSRHDLHGDVMRDALRDYVFDSGNLARTLRSVSDFFDAHGADPTLLLVARDLRELWTDAFPDEHPICLANAGSILAMFGDAIPDPHEVIGRIEPLWLHWTSVRQRYMSVGVATNFKGFPDAVFARFVIETSHADQILSDFVDMVDVLELQSRSTWRELSPSAPGRPDDHHAIAIDLNDL